MSPIVGHGRRYPNALELGAARMSCRLHGHRLPPPPRSPQSLPPDRRSRTGMHVYLPVVSALPSIIRVSIDSSRFTDQLISFLTVIGIYLTRVISNQLLHLHGWMAPRGRQQRSAELLVGKPLQKALRRLLEVSLQHPMQVFCLMPFIVSLHEWYLTYMACFFPLLKLCSWLGFQEQPSLHRAKGLRPHELGINASTTAILSGIYACQEH